MTLRHATIEHPLLWKPDWTEALRALQEWWDHKSLALYVTAPKENIFRIAGVRDGFRPLEYWEKVKAQNRK